MFVLVTDHFHIAQYFIIFDNLLKIFLLHALRLQELLAVDCPLHTPVPFSSTNLDLVRVLVPPPQILEQVPHSLQVPQTQSIAANYIENLH